MLKQDYDMRMKELNEMIKGQAPRADADEGFQTP